MSKFLQIKSVDHYGYNGRNYHPEESDIGLIVRPIKIDIWFIDSEGEGESLTDDSGRIRDGTTGDYEDIISRALPYLHEELREDKENPDQSGIETCYTCVTRDGRILELMDFEVEDLIE